MVLLHVLHELAPRHGWQVTAAHFNHQLRGRSSAADERLVRRTAQQLKVPLVVGQADVRKFARTRKLSLEMAARKLRHEFLARTARRLRIPSVALAHHADDQLELFFLRLLRGSGGEGLAGMKWRSPSPSGLGIELVRPLLAQPKAVLVEYAAEHGIRYREDASNEVLDFQRNRIRHELLPLLRRKYQPALDRIIPRVMDIVGADAEFAAQAAREWLGRGGSPKAEVRRPKETRSAKSEVRGARDRGRGALAFEKLPLAVQRRCVQLQLVGQGIVPEFELVEQLRVKADRPVAIGGAPACEAAPKPPVWEGERPREPKLPGQSAEKSGLAGTLALPGLGANTGICAGGRRGRVPGVRYAVRDASGRVQLQAAGSSDFSASSTEVELEGRAGEVVFGGARIWWRIASKKVVGQPKAGVGGECFDADKVGSRVLLRHWRPGDRFHPIGMASPVKLQDFFTNQKVPRDQRRQLILGVTAKGEVFWVEGMRISERFKLTKRTIRGLQWRWKRL